MIGISWRQKSKKWLYILSLCITFFSCKEGTNSAWEAHVVREEDFNFDWKFALMEDSAVNAGTVDFQDNDWKKIRLPHDWSIEASFDSINGEGATGFLPGGTGWYRKHFKKAISADKVTYLYFDGVYNNAEVWFNGGKAWKPPLRILTILL